MDSSINSSLVSQQGSEQGSGLSFIDVNIPEKLKNEEWHTKVAWGLLRRTLNSSYEQEFALLDQCYRYFDGIQGGDQYKYLQEAEDGSNLPAVWMNLNKIRVKLKILMGELMERGYDLNVRALNKEAISRKLKEKERRLVELRLKPFAGDLEQATGVATPVDAPHESEEDLDEFFGKEYKDIAETVMYHALKFLDKRNLWGANARYKLFLDMLIGGKCFVKNEIINGIPTVRRVDPRFMVYDTFSEDDHLTDSTYFGEVRYMNIADAASKYSMTKKELEEAYKAYTDFLRIRATKARRAVNSSDFMGFDSLSDASNQRWFKQTPNGLRVLVVEAVWVDYKDYKHKVSEDNHGGEHWKRTESLKDKEDVVTKKIKIWRGATIVGGKFTKNWGELPNQPRDLESLQNTEPPYMGIIPDFLNGQPVSLVMQLKSLQNLKDIIHYNIQLVMARAGAKGFIYDVSQCPDGWDVGTVIKYLKTVGIAFINSKQGGTPSQFNQFQQIDLSLSESTRQYLELSMMVDKEMDTISGISEARQGIVQGASQAVGVTRSALLQSSLSTASYFHLFDAFSSRVWNQQAKLVKIAWVNKERFAPIIGDAGVDFLKEDVDLDLNDYGVFVESTPKALDDLNNFQQLIMAALQAGQVEFADAMNLLMEKDVRSAIRKFEKIARKKEKERFEQQRQLQAEQAQQQMANQERMLQNQTQNQQMGAQNAQATQEAKSRADVGHELVKQRGQARLAQIQGQIQKEVAAEAAQHKSTGE